VVHEVEPEVVVNARFLGRCCLVEDEAKSSEFRQQRLDVRLAETV
jgi:hypothetical protein